MLEFAAYLAAQQRTSDLARGALPDAPVQSASLTSSREIPSIAVRQRLSLVLRRLAELIEPAPSTRTPAATGCR